MAVLVFAIVLVIIELLVCVYIYISQRHSTGGGCPPLTPQDV